MFSWLIHSDTRVRMLKMFFKDPEKPLYGLEIAQVLRASPGTIHRELNGMVNQNILSKKRERALIMYRLNTSHPHFSELKKALFPVKHSSRVLFISDLHLSVNSPEDLVNDFQLFLDYAEDHASEIVFVGDMIEMLEGDVFQTYLFHKPLFDRLTQLSHEISITSLVGNHDCFLRLFCHDEGPGRFFDANLGIAQEYLNEKLGIYATHGHQYDNFSEMEGFHRKKFDSTGKKIMAQLRSLKREGYSLHQSQLLAVAEYADKAAQFSEYVTAKKIDFSAKFRKVAHELIEKQHYAYVVFGHTHCAEVKQFGHGVYFNTGSWKSEKKRQFVEIDKDGGALVTVSDLL